MRALNPFIRVVANCSALDESNALSLFDDFDLVVDGSDNFTTRYVVNDASYFTKTPLVSAAVSRYSGQISVYNLNCLLYTSPSPRDGLLSRMPSSA